MEQVNALYYGETGDDGSLFPPYINVYCHGFSIGRYKIGSFGKDGLMVLNGDRPIPRKNSFLEVEFWIGSLDNRKQFRLPVYVHADENNGVKLHYVDYGKGVIQELIEMLR
jgi:hypothetical protein